MNEHNQLIFAVLLGFGVAVAIALVAAPSINALINPPMKVTDNINKIIVSKGQVLVFADQIDNFKWEAMSLDESTFYYHTFNEDGTRVENTYTKSKNTKPYLYWISREAGVSENYVYPDTRNIIKQKNTVVDLPF